MVTVVKEEAKQGFSDALGQGLGNLITSGTEAYKNRSDQVAIQKSLNDLGPNASPRQILDALTNTKTHGTQAKQQALSNYLGVEQFEELKRKAAKKEQIAEDKNRISALGKMSPEERKMSYDNFIARGYDSVDAEAMVSPYVSDGTKQNISRRIEDDISRGIRKPVGSPQAEADISQSEPSNEQQVQTPETTPEEKNAVNNEQPLETKPLQNKDEWPSILEPSDLKSAERVKWRDKNHTFNRKELKDLRSKNQANTDALIHYSRLRELNDTGKVQDGLSRILIDPETGEPYKNVQKLSGVNKETQQYIKTLNDFISQAKNFFGARVTNFDLSSFKSRLPSLLNTEEGRRAIIEQMDLLTQLQSAHDSTLSEGIKHYGDKASYIDIVKSADDKVMGKEEKIIAKINLLDSATKYLDMMQSNPKYKGLTMMFSPETKKFIAVRPSDIEAVKKQGYEAWRTQN